MRPVRLLVLLCSVWVAMAQPPDADPTDPSGALEGEMVGDTLYVDAAWLAAQLGDVVTASAGTLTWRGSEGVVTLFGASTEALLSSPADGGPTEWTLSAPVREGDPTGVAGWAVPLDAVELVGVFAQRTGGTVVIRLPDGRSFVYEPPVASSDSAADWELVDVAGAVGLRMFSGDHSALLLDLSLLPLGFPLATEAVDAARERAGGDQVLLLIGTSSTRSAFPTELTFEQVGTSISVRAPFRVHVFVGDRSSVGPANELAALVLLPPSFSLYRELAVSWQGVQASVSFRR